MEPSDDLGRRKGDMDSTNEAAYADFVTGHWRDLVRAAVFLGAEHHEADDLVQTVLVRCYTNWDKVSAATNSEAYVYRMLLNALRDVRRSHWWRSRGLSVTEQPTEDNTEAIATADAVHRAMAGLSRVNREVVVLRYFVQLSEAQTAATLGVATGTVKSRLSRALAHLATDRHLTDIAGDQA
jgi:RNA polymerase sigma-70 factor (sigma-E family)